MYESSRYQTIDTTRRCINAATVTTFLLVPVMLYVPTVSAQSKLYTNTSDFSSAYKINSEGVDDVPPNGHLAIRTVPETLPYIWVACSTRGTVVRIAASTFDPITQQTVTVGQVLGEYLTGPTNADGSLLCGRNPSRTSVYFDGNVWVGNRYDDPHGDGSVVKIGSGFAFQWKGPQGDTPYGTLTVKLEQRRRFPLPRSLCSRYNLMRSTSFSLGVGYIQENKSCAE